MATAAVPTPSSATTGVPPVPVRIPVREVLPWAVFMGALMLFLIYFVGAEQGATAIFSGTGVHEFVHDGRHLLAFPCH
ncbi:CbtB domain-containing protein [Yinghuangia sp. YIM S09857]|uniref:CbtB domain-containing protein n=1 Tax=Yinghuangia sp. YIM S09857 TaxID=3436929 RepID=UPI003F52A9B1